MFGLGLSTAFNGILGLAAPICFGQMKTAYGGNIEVLYTAGKPAESDKKIRTQGLLRY